MSKGFARAGVAALVLVGGVTAGMGIARAALAGAPPCYASKGTTEYWFEGAAEFGPTSETHFEVHRYTASFIAKDTENPDEIPADAKNDVEVEVRRDGNHQVIAETHSPDSLDFNTKDPFIGALPPHGIRQGDFVYVHFAPNFDRRDEADPSCQSRTLAFSAAGQQADPSLEPVCDKAGDLCRAIDPD